jgi:hypothetical protein
LGLSLSREGTCRVLLRLAVAHKKARPIGSIDRKKKRRRRRLVPSFPSLARIRKPAPPDDIKTTAATRVPLNNQK